MKRFMIYLFMLLVTSGLFANDLLIDGWQAGSWTMDLTAAEAAAARTGLPILLKLTSNGCMGSLQLEQTIFASQEWKNWSKNNLITVFIDFDSIIKPGAEKYRDRNERLGKIYSITHYPTFILLDSDGKSILGMPWISANFALTIKSIKYELETSRRNIDRLAQTMPSDTARNFMAMADKLRTNSQELANWRARMSFYDVAESTKRIDMLLTTALISKMTEPARVRYYAAMSTIKDAQDALSICSFPVLDQNQRTQKEAEIHAAVLAMDAELDVVRQNYGLQFKSKAVAPLSTEPLLSGKQPGRWTMDLDAVKADRQTSHLPLLLKFVMSRYVDTYNRKIETEILSQAAWQSWAASNLNLVQIELSFEDANVPNEYRARNWDLMNFYGVKNYFHYILLDPDDGTELAYIDNQLNAITDFNAILRRGLMATERYLPAVATLMPPAQYQEYSTAVKTLAEQRRAITAWRNSKPDDQTAQLRGDLRQEVYKQYIRILSSQANSRYKSIRDKISAETDAFVLWQRTANRASPEYSAALKSLNERLAVLRADAEKELEKFKIEW